MAAVQLTLLPYRRCSGRGGRLLRCLAPAAERQYRLGGPVMKSTKALKEFEGYLLRSGDRGAPKTPPAGFARMLDYGHPAALRMRSISPSSAGSRTSGKIWASSIPSSAMDSVA